MSVQWTCIVKNSGGAPVLVADLGISIPATSQITLSDYFGYRRITDSFDLRDLVTAATLVINNGTADLSSADGLDWITQDNLYSRDSELTNYYTKADLQGDGSAQVHWNNIANAPSFGAPTWIDPVEYRVLDIAASAPGSPNAGDVYVDTDDNHYYKYIPVLEVQSFSVTGEPTADGNITVDGETIAILDADTTDQVATKIRAHSFTNWDTSGTGSNVILTAKTYGDKTLVVVDAGTTGATFSVVSEDTPGTDWVDQGAATTEDRVINLADATETIYSFGGSSWTDTNIPTEDNTACVVNDDGDGKQAQYVWDSTSSSWIKIADIDFGPHLDGGASKHDASEIDVEGTYSSIPGTPTDLESTISAINTALGTANETLDDAYDVGGAGAGRAITADAGAVKIDTAAATNAPLELTNKASAPTTGLAAGQLAVINNVFYCYDGVRAKWLSIQRATFVFGRDGKTKDQWLYLSTGNPSNLGGYRLKQNGTIISMTGQLSASGTGDMQVQKNDGGSAIATLSITAATGNDVDNTNVDVSKSDYLQAYVTSTAGIEDPTFVVEIAYRP